MSKRTDASGAAFKGSQKQIQLYVNSNTNELNCAVATALGAQLNGEIKWKSPLSQENQKGFLEFSDSAFLKALELEHLNSDLERFWPGGGPRWDALARTSKGEVLLVEAKSYPREMRGAGSNAQPSSLTKITNRLEDTAHKLGLSSLPASWTGDLYQSANRLAHLQFLRDHEIHAFLINVCFVRDHEHIPVELGEWRLSLRAYKEELGVDVVPFVTEVFLPALAS